MDISITLDFIDLMQKLNTAFNLDIGFDWKTRMPALRDALRDITTKAKITADRIDIPRGVDEMKIDGKIILSDLEKEFKEITVKLEQELGKISFLIHLN